MDIIHSNKVIVSEFYVDKLDSYLDVGHHLRLQPPDGLLHSSIKAGKTLSFSNWLVASGVTVEIRLLTLAYA